MSSTSDSANEFGIRQRLLAGVTCNLFAQRLTTLVAELRDSLEIIDADSRTFAKYRERDVYWNAHLSLTGVAQSLYALSDRLKSKGADDD
jgi:hypothetical protein